MFLLLVFTGSHQISVVVLGTQNVRQSLMEIHQLFQNFNTTSFSHFYSPPKHLLFFSVLTTIGLYSRALIDWHVFCYLDLIQKNQLAMYALHAKAC